MQSRCELTVVDYGDASAPTSTSNMSAERSMAPVRALAQRDCRDGRHPDDRGGGPFARQYPDVACDCRPTRLRTRRMSASSTAALDSTLRPRLEHIAGHLISPSASPSDASWRKATCSVRTTFKSAFTPEATGRGEDGFRFMREHGFRYHTMAEIERDGWEPVMKTLRGSGQVSRLDRTSCTSRPDICTCMDPDWMQAG